MTEALAMVIGMSVAYLASFMGLVLAWYSYRKHHPKKREPEEK